MKATGIAVRNRIFFMSFLDIPPFQKRAFEVKVELIGSYLEFVLNWYPMTNELVISPGREIISACARYNLKIKKHYCRMTTPFW